MDLINHRTLDFAFVSPRVLLQVRLEEKKSKMLWMLCHLETVNRTRMTKVRRKQFNENTFEFLAQLLKCKQFIAGFIQSMRFVAGIRCTYFVIGGVKL